MAGDWVVVFCVNKCQISLVAPSHVSVLVAVAVSVCGAGLVYPGSPAPAQTVRYAHSPRSTGTQTGYWETTITINKTYTPQEK